MRPFSIVLLGFLLVFSACRTNTPSNKTAPKGDLSAFFQYEAGREVLISAHRGGKGMEGYPENCLETMQYVKTQIPNAIYEVDIAQSADGVLLLMGSCALIGYSSSFDSALFP